MQPVVIFQKRIQTNHISIILHLWRLHHFNIKKKGCFYSIFPVQILYVVNMNKVLNYKVFQNKPMLNTLADI